MGLADPINMHPHAWGGACELYPNWVKQIRAFFLFRPDKILKFYSFLVMQQVALHHQNDLRLYSGAPAIIQSMMSCSSSEVNWPKCGCAPDCFCTSRLLVGSPGRITGPLSLPFINPW